MTTSQPMTICRKEIIDRDAGWTPKIIDKLLGAPYEVKPKLDYKKAAPMKFYRVDQVEAVEATYEFRELVSKVAKRKCSALDAAYDDAINLLTHIDSLPIRIKPMAFEKLLSLAFGDCDVNEERGNPRVHRITSKDAPADTKLRLCLNYIRHELSTYRNILNEFQHAGTSIVVCNHLKERIREAALNAYPELAQLDAQAREPNELRGVSKQGRGTSRAARASLLDAVMQERCGCNSREAEADLRNAYAKAITKWGPSANASRALALVHLIYIHSGTKNRTEAVHLADMVKHNLPNCGITSRTGHPRLTNEDTAGK